jgi:hypothetical protein
MKDASNELKYKNYNFKINLLLPCNKARLKNLKSTYKLSLATNGNLVKGLKLKRFRLGDLT